MWAKENVEDERFRLVLTFEWAFHSLCQSAEYDILGSLLVS